VRPLDVFLVRKLGVPGHEELALGAIATGGTRALNEQLINSLDIPREWVEAIDAKEMRELERVVIPVDDGFATGSTMVAVGQVGRWPVAPIDALPPYEHAQRLINEGRAVLDDRDDWSEHQPSAQDENRYLEEHGFSQYGRWFLGVDDEQPRDTKSHYKFPYGDFESVHRCGVLAAESRAGQYKHDDVKAAAAHLHGMLEALSARRSRS
jgi:hypothetical protein